MKKRWYAIAVIVVLTAVVAAGSLRVRAADEETGPDKLAVLWTSGDPDVAHRVCLMYTHAAKRNGWFDDIQFVVWGPSQRLLVADKDILAKVKAMQDDGIVVEACIACATSYGLVDKIRALGIEVKPMGAPLTDFLKNGYRVLTF